MYELTINEEKLRKRAPKSSRIWMDYKEEAKRAIESLLRSKWIKGGRVYVRRKQEKMVRYSPIMILIDLDKNIPKFDYVGLSFNFVDEISRNISFTSKSRGVEKSNNYKLIGNFTRT